MPEDLCHKAEPRQPQAPEKTDAVSPSTPRRFGFLAGKIRVPDDFDRMGEEEIAQLFSAQAEE